jgi:VIT1/CCC1 family predicted Fe2+/Mn2+ transporter
VSPDADQRAALAADHTPEAIAARLAAGPDQSYLRDLVLGAIDGCVTTFAVVAGVAGAGLPAGVILVLGLANLLADGFSMAVSNFQGLKAERQVRQRARLSEERQIAEVPEGEREEIRQIFAARGLAGDDLDQLVRIVTSNPRLWVETMLDLELGLPPDGSSPWRAGLSTFAAFLAAGLVPLLVFILELFWPGRVDNPFLWSTLLTGAAFFVVGALKSYFVEQSWYLAGLETLTVGGAAAALAYSVGLLLKQVAGMAL